MLKKIVITLFLLILLSLAGAVGWLYYQVVVEPGEEIRPENIQAILGKESHVFYSDGQTRLGAFFDTAHRQYVSYSEIPPAFINALVASEDSRFFSHYGFDPAGIARAMVKNYQAGKVVQGGSTLTQQTAKNLFKRTERSYRAKLVELLYALRLEYHYSKEKIFEYYANQFYVSGNGHGLGVAARYYFDKKPEELSLVECAFIAGSVKSPNYYNPFRKKTEKGVELAKSRAAIRLKYVLGKMLEEGMIDRATYKAALVEGINFKNGRVGYPLNHAMELVREAVSSEEVRQALAASGISNIATSGVRVVTTLDHKLQQMSLSTLRSELSRLDVRLRGYQRGEVQQELAALAYGGDYLAAPGSFHFGSIVDKRGKGKEVEIEVELDGKLGRGIIDGQGLEKLVLALARYSRNRWSESKKEDLAALVDALEVEDRVWVQIKSLAASGEDGRTMLSLEKYPQLQGGAIVLDKGRVRGLAGGVENRFFNRAIKAKRTMGSAFKPLLFTAAIQLGWSNADLLYNTRDIFVYQGQAYFPRPDHSSPHAWVSMNWAGVKSENIASIWLLSKLLDQLSDEQFMEVADHLGLMPRLKDGVEEPYRIYRSRIRDRHGIQVTKENLRKAAFLRAVKNLEADFLFEGRDSEYESLAALHYGLYFDRFLEELELDFAENEKPVKEHIKKEYLLRKELLQNSFLQYEKRLSGLQSLRRLLGTGTDPFRPEGFEYQQTAMENEDGALFYREADGAFFYLPVAEKGEGMGMVGRLPLQRYLSRLTGHEKDLFWGTIGFGNGITAAGLDLVEEQLELELKRLSVKLPYEPKTLAEIDDFRTMVSLHYLLALARELGIESELAPVLSFPLGSNVVTLLEGTRMYEALVTGEVNFFSPDQRESGDFAEDEEAEEVALAVIDRIEDADGHVLYRPHREVQRVVDPKTAMEVSSILENTVKFGTGRYAHRNVMLASEEEGLELSIPLLGKTGTANRYTNASFFGYLPGIAKDKTALVLEDGYALGVYVGFDDNQPMRHKTTRIAGAAGALPIWSAMAGAIIEEHQYGEALDPVELSFYGLAIKRAELGQMNLKALPDNGGSLAQPVQKIPEISRMDPAIIAFGGTEGETFRAERRFLPFWRVEQE